MARAVLARAPAGALCGSSESKTAFIFLSAPDQRSRYGPVRARLFFLNPGVADPP